MKLVVETSGGLMFFSRTCYQCSRRDDSRRKDGAGSCGRMMNTMGCGSWKFESIREHDGMTTGGIAAGHTYKYG